MNTFDQLARRTLGEQRLRRPFFVSRKRSHELAHTLAREFSGTHVEPNEVELTGRDVILVHSGEMGWSELLGAVCQQSPRRLFILAPECPHIESLKMDWIADLKLVGDETFPYEGAELKCLA